MKITFITDKETAPEDMDGEFIYFGAPRLFQIFQAVKQNGRFTRIYEKIVSAGARVPLQPWLGLNVVISYQSDMKKTDFCLCTASCFWNNYRRVSAEACTASADLANIRLLLYHIADD